MNVSVTNPIQIPQNMSSNAKRDSTLSLEQQTLIEETLAKYDSSSLSKKDALEIVDAFKEAGIEPSKELAAALSSVGFDAKEIGDLAGASGNTAGSRPTGGPPPPPPPSSEEEISSIYDLLESLLSSDEEEASTATTSSLLTGTGYDDESSSFETVLDYTSKIIRLKDDARSEVMNMLNEYNADETNSENEQMQKDLIGSLSEILNKTDNYNRMSFYA
ncbi:MAG: hypothetical protein JKY28_00840 [Sulfurimonas sp.]|nr:hypothetical protein [Sulfurimonas sp.]PHQ88867.1 MAG: hypothetical protein COB42_08005 [Sulfurimonas sp.]